MTFGSQINLRHVGSPRSHPKEPLHSDEGPSPLWVMNRSGSKRFPVIMMSVCGQQGACVPHEKGSLLPDKCLFNQRVPLQLLPARSQTQQTACSIGRDRVFAIPCNYLDMHCTAHTRVLLGSLFLHRKRMMWRELAKLWPRLLWALLKVPQVTTTLTTGSIPLR